MCMYVCVSIRVSHFAVERSTAVAAVIAVASISTIIVAIATRVSRHKILEDGPGEHPRRFFPSCHQTLLSPLFVQLCLELGSDGLVDFVGSVCHKEDRSDRALDTQHQNKETGKVRIVESVQHKDQGCDRQVVGSVSQIFLSEKEDTETTTTTTTTTRGNEKECMSR